MDGDPLDEHVARLEELASDLLGHYAAGLTQQPPAAAKEFNDPIWGTLYLRPVEVALLDSPLLQRLRRIRQLGVVHLVYPGATHTRLEHSLGVVHQVQRMVTSLNDRCATQAGHANVPPDLESVLRLAALCHDIGHGFMSHVSEFALASNRSAVDLQLAFQQRYQVSDVPQLSEIAAHAMIGSPAFRDLIAIAHDRAEEYFDDQIITKMQRLILGQQVHEDFVLLHEFISGPFDADKLDYYARDAYMCGIPNITDIPRLIQKLRATEVLGQRLPQPLRKALPMRDKPFVVTGIAASGGRTLDEIALARTLLYDKVYRHQKVRAAEMMVAGIVELLSALAPDRAALVPFKFFDDEVLALDGPRAAERLGVTVEEVDSLTVVADLSGRLRERVLFKRAFAFASMMTGDDYRNDVGQKDGMQRFLSAAASRPEAFMAVVIDLVREIVALAGLTLPCRDKDLIYYIRLSPPKTTTSQDKSRVARAQLVETDGSVTPFGDDAAETTPWNAAYTNTRDLGHAFCPAELTAPVFIAMRVALLSQYGVRVPNSMLNYAKQEAGQVDALLRTLEQEGWFHDKPAELLPEPEVLRTIDAADRVEKVAALLRGYWGPTRADDANDQAGAAGTVGAAQVSAFVRQFAEGGDSVVDNALDALTRLKVVGRSDIVQAVSEFVSRNPEFAGASCAPLGGTRDSSQILTYYVGDLADELNLRLTNVEQAVLDDEPILFIDDFIGTGHQALDIVQSWLGLELVEPLGETRDVLPPPAQELFRTRKVGFVFAAATGDGPDVLTQTLRDVGLDVADTHVALSRGDLPRLDKQEMAELVTFCRGRGMELMSDYDGKSRDSAWVAEKALGYGNDAFLVASAFNTPTAALTVLWAGDERWRPLLPRRTKR